MVGEDRTNYTLANSVFVGIAGTNDLLITYLTLGLKRFEYDLPSYAHLVVTYASEFIQVLNYISYYILVIHACMCMDICVCVCV